MAVKAEETRLDAFEMKGLRKNSAGFVDSKETNEWVLNKAGVKKELLDTVKARKLAYCGHTMRKLGELPGDNARNNSRFTQARKTTHGWTTSRRGQDSRGRVSQNDRGHG